MTAGSGPREFAVTLLATCEGVREVELSTYVNFPQSLVDRRESVRVPVGEMEGRFEEMMASLGPDEEIAFHSRVHVRGGTRTLRPRHFPLVDFKTAERAVAERAAELLVGELGAPSAALFDSGRSFHLYAGALLSEARWNRFMGRILLLNPREGSPVVDNRWVGHRLMTGFGALRWSANTAPYTAPPRLVRRWALLE